jgi:hypothetical protein
MKTNDPEKPGMWGGKGFAAKQIILEIHLAYQQAQKQATVRDF